MSGDIVKRDLKYLWHPYTQMKDMEEMPPVEICRARGALLYDRSGNKYYDTISSWWCNVHGHCHPQIVEAVKDQIGALDHVLFAGFTHAPAVELAERLSSISPEGLDRIFYSDNGSTAVEVALKLSFQYWRNHGCRGKEKFISLTCGYHGDTIGAMSVSGVSLFNDTFSSLFFGGYRLSSPAVPGSCPEQMKVRAAEKVLSELEDLLEAEHEKIAAVIMEPLLMGAAGMHMYHPSFLAGARMLTTKYNVHMIIDEVATGFGRTGKMFACEYAGIVPDIMCVSKGITSGTLPLGATLTNEEVFGSFYADVSEGKTFYHGHTYTANPVACAAGVAALDIFEDEDTLTNCGRINSMLSDFMQSISVSPVIGDVRCLGAVGALDIVRDKDNNDPFPAEERVGKRIFREALSAGVLLRPLGDTIYFFLPLCLQKPELEDIFDRAATLLRNVEKWR